MNIVKPIAVLGLTVIFGISLHKPPDTVDSKKKDTFDFPTEDHSPIHSNGTYIHAEKHAQVFTPVEVEKLGFPVVSEELVIALRNQLHVLRASNFKDDKKFGNLGLTYEEMETVIEILIERQGFQPDDLHRYLEAQEVWGNREHKGHVYFTGYYTPELKLRKTPHGKYQYPVYAYPSGWQGSMPSREEIEKDGALEGLGLELGYASDPVDVASMQLQGSGYVHFVDTDESYLFRYAGQNGHSYRNIQRFFKDRKDLKIGNISYMGIKKFLRKKPELRDSVLFYNPSYTFFAPTKGLVKGSGEVPLMKNISVAADPTVFPPGSVLLAAVPVADKNGNATHHEYRILLPQDVGGAIRGTGRIDVYCGVGKGGQQVASRLHHYGKVWLLTPKADEQIAGLMNND